MFLIVFILAIPILYKFYRAEVGHRDAQTKRSSQVSQLERCWAPDANIKFAINEPLLANSFCDSQSTSSCLFDIEALKIKKFRSFSPETFPESAGPQIFGLDFELNHKRDSCR